LYNYITGCKALKNNFSNVSLHFSNTIACLALHVHSFLSWCIVSGILPKTGSLFTDREMCLALHVHSFLSWCIVSGILPKTGSLFTDREISARKEPLHAADTGMHSF